MNNNTSDEDKHDTNYINNKYTNTYTRKLHNLWALHLERAVSLHLLMSVSHTPHGSRCSWVSSHPHSHPCAFLSDFTFLPFYFDLTFTVLFHFSFLMHPSSTLSSTTWSPCNTTCAPPRRGVTTPTTSTPPSQSHHTHAGTRGTLKMSKTTHT